MTIISYVVNILVNKAVNMVVKIPSAIIVSIFHIFIIAKLSDHLFPTDLDRWPNLKQSNTTLW